MSTDKSVRASSDLDQTQSLVKGLIHQINEFKGVLPETKNYTSEINKKIEEVNILEDLSLQRVDFISEMRQE
jgi:hypothetical protein